ncbi:MAG TPA: dienelactone hydrolase family protein [Candidatus Acidoferrales bacterium]|nr:dienelactone hydrolase family protein [Candidatus Acidoferrales bacterium]
MSKIATQRVTLQVADGTTMSAYTARPAEEGKAPGMLVFQEAFGVNAHIRDITERVAREGYVAVAPELYHRTAPGFEGSYTDFQAVMPHMQAMKEDSIVHDVRAAYDWLKADPQVSSDRIASIGFCMGGRVSFLTCSVVPLRAAISFYGGGIAPALLPRAASLSGPMLLFWGGLDKHIPQEQIRSIVDELKRVGKTFINVDISDADHGFFCDARASYNANAATLAWGLVLQFLNIHVKGSGQKAQGA